NPWENERLDTTLLNQAALGRAIRKADRLEGENQHLRERDGLPQLIAESRAMEPVLDIMRRVAPSEANVLIRGEHGTGKDVLARWLHAASGRADKSLVSVNVGGFSEGVFESEVFGHVRGAFTDAKSDRVGCFELADGGTLFLDEIANITPQQQAKLLRVLETGEVQRVGSSKVRTVDVRVLSATNAELETAVREGAFREDLLYRLNTVEIHLPPLRERTEDLIPLSLHFLARAAARYEREAKGLSGDAAEVILRHSWPGNVREMEHAMHRAVLMARGPEVTAVDLMLRRKGEEESGALESLTLDEAERVLIERALERHGGNVTRAAEQLGLSRSALYRRLQRHDLST
ncbi:MAG: sigma-54 dependent transcriptional regulator, partial [Gemmatimonadota bacterium]